MSERAAPTTEETLPVVSLSAGDYLFRSGDPSEAFFIVRTGHVELLRRNTTYGRLALLVPGDVCGEDAAFTGETRTHDARALTAATLLRVAPALFADLVRESPEVAGAVVGRIAGALAQARAARLGLALPPPAGRLGAAHFIHLESGTVFAVPETTPAVVGRGDPATKFQPDIELSSVDAHRSLSRRHAFLTQSETGYQITEGPRVGNGTFHNGRKLEAGVAVPITDGDEVSFGLITTIFRTT